MILTHQPAGTVALALPPQRDSEQLPMPALPVDPAPAASRAEALLAAHVPLSLLLDLSDAAGPSSSELFSVEVAQPTG